MPAAKIIATNVYSVILPPPIRSASLPPNGREMEPSSGPRKEICAACSEACAAVSPPARKLICSTWPNANEKPMNEPNVPMYRKLITQECL